MMQATDVSGEDAIDIHLLNLLSKHVDLRNYPPVYDLRYGRTNQEVGH